MAVSVGLHPFPAVPVLRTIRTRPVLVLTAGSEEATGLPGRRCRRPNATHTLPRGLSGLFAGADAEDWAGGWWAGDVEGVVASFERKSGLMM